MHHILNCCFVAVTIKERNSSEISYFELGKISVKPVIINFFEYVLHHQLQLVLVSHSFANTEHSCPSFSSLEFPTCDRTSRRMRHLQGAHVAHTHVLPCPLVRPLDPTHRHPDVNRV